MTEYELRDPPHRLDEAPPGNCFDVRVDGRRVGDVIQYIDGSWAAWCMRDRYGRFLGTHATRAGAAEAVASHEVSA